jgi:hypothetical protein
MTPGRPPCDEQLIRWPEYIESAQTVDVSAEDRKRLREFADEALRAKRGYDETVEDWG